MKFSANAKINLSLDVVGRLDNGYHEVSMIMQEISLCDFVEIIPNNSGKISLSLKNSNLPCDEGNIAYRAAQKFYEQSLITPGCDIILEKHIPVCAGLGGGSADGAAVLKGLNSIYNNPLDTDTLLKLGLTLGADVPFCILGKTAHAGGIGEVLTPIASALDLHIALIKPDIDISTPEAYRAIDSVGIVHPQIDLAIDAITKADIASFANHAGNAFEQVCCPKYPEIDYIKNHLCKNGALFAMMSGSGPTVFGLFESRTDAQKAFDTYSGSFQGGGVCKMII